MKKGRWRHAFLWNVTFTESGLPAGAVWSITVDGAEAGPTANESLTLRESNGSHSFVIGSSYAYETDPTVGDVSVTPQSLSFLFNFFERPSFLVGIVSPVSATLEVDGSTAPVLGGIVNITVPPGNHSVESSATGYRTWWGNLTTTAGNATSFDLRLNASGAPAGVGPGGGGLGEGNSTIVILGAGLASGILIVATVVVLRRTPPLNRSREPPSKDRGR